MRNADQTVRRRSLLYFTDSPRHRAMDNSCVDVLVGEIGAHDLSLAELRRKVLRNTRN